MEKIDALVIGAGAVGLAVSRALAQAGRETIVVERESGIGQDVSSRNSEVIHAGLHTTHLARQFRGFAAEHISQEHYAKGSYYSLAGRSPFSHLIYPAPTGAWLGVHLTLDLGGQAKFGPDLEWLDTHDPDTIAYTADPRRADAFFDAVRRYWRALPDDALRPSYSGVRPKIYAPGQPSADFRIDGPAVHGVCGWMNLFGIESPGQTSSMAIAERWLGRSLPSKFSAIHNTTLR